MSDINSQTNTSPQSNNSIQANPYPTSNESSVSQTNPTVSKDEIVALRVKDAVLDSDNIVIRINRSMCQVLPPCLTF